jgi:hypothetical protein
VSVRQHVHLLYLVTSFWAWFFLGGLWSQYYQAWPPWAQLVVVDLVPAGAMIGMGPTLIRRADPAHPMRAALVVAAYFSIPFLLYDFIYIGLYLDKPWSYLLDYWYLTAFSAVPWMTFPLTTLLLRGRGSARVPVT